MPEPSTFTRLASFFAALAFLAGCTPAAPGLPEHIEKAVAENPPAPRGTPLYDQADKSTSFLATPYTEQTLAETVSISLSRIGQPAVPHLRQMLQDPDPRLREEAAEVLAGIGPEAQEAVPDLLHVLRTDPDLEVRKAAARALGQIGPAAAPAAPELLEVLRQELRQSAEDPATGGASAGTEPSGQESLEAMPAREGESP